MRLHFELALTETARIIGYDGISMTDFWKKAKRLDLPQHDILMAVYDLTRADKREGVEPRYELNGEARRLCFGILGPAPDHPLHDFIRHGPGGLVGDEIGKWQEDYRRQKAEEEAHPEQSKKRGRRR